MVTVTQSLVATTTALSASATAINTGDSVTFTAKVSPQSGTTILHRRGHLHEWSDHSGHGDVLNASGTATFSTDDSARRRLDPITASYGGSSTNSSSLSAAVGVRSLVTQTLVATTTSLTASTTQINTLAKA